MKIEPNSPLWPADRVERRALASLTPYARNARTHTPAQVSQVAASMREWGWTNPVLVDEGGGIIAGHCRVLAAAELGFTEAPVMVAAGWTEEQRAAYVLADNQLAMNAGWDVEMLGEEFSGLKAQGFNVDLLGFKPGEIDKMLKDTQKSPVVVRELPRHPVTRMGDVWLLGRHRLMCGDSTDHAQVRTLMAGKRAILFATDPPYLVDYDGNTWDDSKQGPELYDAFIAAAIAEAILPNAAWYCWHASVRQAMVEACWERAGAFVHQQIIWCKDRPVLTRSHYLWKHEPCFYGWVKGTRPPKIDGSDMLSSVWKLTGDLLTTVWEIAGLDGVDLPDHPTPKPIECFAIPIRQHVRRNQICYEPFCGSGTQIMAGEMLERSVYAMEMEPAYVDVAIARWQDTTEVDATLESTGQTFSDVIGERLVPA